MRAYSITSAARANRVGSTSRPSALAVLRLITSSTLNRLHNRQISRLSSAEDTCSVDANLVQVSEELVKQCDNLSAVGKHYTKAVAVSDAIPIGTGAARQLKLRFCVVGRVGNFYLRARMGWWARETFSAHGGRLRTVCRLRNHQFALELIAVEVKNKNPND